MHVCSQHDGLGRTQKTAAVRCQSHNDEPLLSVSVSAGWFRGRSVADTQYVCVRVL
jgi:hypothetical protein